MVEQPVGEQLERRAGDAAHGIVGDGLFPQHSADQPVHQEQFTVARPGHQAGGNTPLDRPTQLTLGRLLTSQRGQEIRRYTVGREHRQRLQHAAGQLIGLGISIQCRIGGPGDTFRAGQQHRLNHRARIVAADAAAQCLVQRVRAQLGQVIPVAAPAPARAGNRGRGDRQRQGEVAELNGERIGAGRILQPGDPREVVDRFVPVKHVERQPLAEFGERLIGAGDHYPDRAGHREERAQPVGVGGVVEHQQSGLASGGQGIAQAASRLRRITLGIGDAQRVRSGGQICQQAVRFLGVEPEHQTAAVGDPRSGKLRRELALADPAESGDHGHHRSLANLARERVGRRAHHQCGRRGRDRADDDLGRRSAQHSAGIAPVPVLAVAVP
ncbi:hypothetical protein SKPI104516_01930 [Skermania piniformis]